MPLDPELTLEPDRALEYERDLEDDRAREDVGVLVVHELESLRMACDECDWESELEADGDWEVESELSGSWIVMEHSQRIELAMLI